MKKIMVAGIIFLAVLVVFSASYLVLKQNNSPSITPCAEAGEFYSNPSLGPNGAPTKECCEGLNKISSAPESDFEKIGDRYITSPGYGLICSACGNGNCETWEHQYNCPKDCESKTNNISFCAKEGERFSFVYKEEYPEHCCSGLTEWGSGMDTRISVEGICYGTEMASGYPVGTCINCGNNICDKGESVCNCPDDCKGGEHSSYSTIEKFCDEYVGVNTGITSMCEENTFDLPLCELCEWK